MPGVFFVTGSGRSPNGHSDQLDADIRVKGYGLTMTIVTRLAFLGRNGVTVASCREYVGRFAVLTMSGAVALRVAIWVPCNLRRFKPVHLA